MKKGIALRLRQSILACVAAFTAATPVAAADLTLAIHPINSAEATFRIYQPLADYLTRATGHSVRIATTTNFLVHWQLAKRNVYHLILEDPHLVDYRVKEMGYTLLVQEPDVTSYALVAHQSQAVLEAADLVGKTVATMPSPALGALRLNQLFPHTLRQPRVVEVDHIEDAVKRVTDGKADGAIIPAATAHHYPSVVPITYTDEAPAPAITASPAVPDDVQRAIRTALLDAHKSSEGRAALKLMEIERFEPGNPQRYQGYSTLLEGIWGY